MRQLFRLLFFLSIAACGDAINTEKSATAHIPVEQSDSTNRALSYRYRFDTSYGISIGHQPFMVTGFFNPDDILDSAILVKHKKTGKDALLIHTGGHQKIFLLKTGKDIGTDFDDFNWVAQFEVIKKGTRIWNNVIDGEMVGEDQVPDKDKITLNTDGIFVHQDEGGGGGIIYFNNGKYVWIQQD